MRIRGNPITVIVLSLGLLAGCDVEPETAEGGELTAGGKADSFGRPRFRGGRITPPGAAGAGGGHFESPLCRSTRRPEDWARHGCVGDPDYGKVSQIPAGPRRRPLTAADLGIDLSRIAQEGYTDEQLQELVDRIAAWLDGRFDTPVLQYEFVGGPGGDYEILAVETEDGAFLIFTTPTSADAWLATPWPAHAGPLPVDSFIVVADPIFDRLASRAAEGGVRYDRGRLGASSGTEPRFVSVWGAATAHVQGGISAGPNDLLSRAMFKRGLTADFADGVRLMGYATGLAAAGALLLKAADIGLAGLPAAAATGGFLGVAGDVAVVGMIGLIGVGLEVGAAVLVNMATDEFSEPEGSAGNGASGSGGSGEGQGGSSGSSSGSGGDSSGSSGSGGDSSGSGGSGGDSTGGGGDSSGGGGAGGSDSTPACDRAVGDGCSEPVPEALARILSWPGVWPFVRSFPSDLLAPLIYTVEDRRYGHEIPLSPTLCGQGNIDCNELEVTGFGPPSLNPPGSGYTDPADPSTGAGSGRTPGTGTGAPRGGGASGWVCSRRWVMTIDRSICGYCAVDRDPLSGRRPRPWVCPDLSRASIGP